jgi:UDP-galactopyranose mutase
LLDHAFLSLPIDEYFDFALGSLPCRSIRFYKAVPLADLEAPVATINFTHEGPLMSETYWHLLPDQSGGGASVTRTREDPCAYHENDNERYYPVKTADGRYQVFYREYQQLALREPHVVFMGRCGIINISIWTR